MIAFFTEERSEAQRAGGACSGKSRDWDTGLMPFLLWVGKHVPGTSAVCVVTMAATLVPSEGKRKSGRRANEAARV